jgi:hypothetical protein
MDDYQGVMNLLIGSKLVTINVDEDGYFSYTMSKTKKVGTSIVALVRDTDGTIWDTNRTTVTLALPETPELLTETIFESTKTIKLFCTDRATAVVKIGSKYYKTDQCVYDSKRGGYVYTVTVKKQAEAEQTVIAYMMNATGKSGKVKTVVEADPEPDTDVETEIAAEEE